MSPRPDGPGFERAQTRRQQRTDHTGEDVTRTCRRCPGAAGVVDQHLTAGIRDHRRMALQQDRDSEACGKSTRGRDPVVAKSCESSELAGVGRQQCRRGPGCDKFGTLSEEGKSVRIDNNGYISSQHRRQKSRGVVVGTIPGPTTHA